MQLQYDSGRRRSSNRFLGRDIKSISKKIGQSALDEICERMQTGFRSGRYSESILFAIEEFTQLFQKYFPSEKQNPNELSDRPEVM
ncbi:hypothetical protein LBBP_03341 [Leptospira borgpetersenii serovar Ballum]|uniref:Uncharacterized protein n=3 Tax=Leptospira borgpetersenii TaxID=174 RepID=A0A0S2IV62_LEPBO|nr:hypothetical protein LBBP_03341 [Leptospira borgpetersenii serovar Ballum]